MCTRSRLDCRAWLGQGLDAAALTKMVTWVLANGVGNPAMLPNKPAGVGTLWSWDGDSQVVRVGWDEGHAPLRRGSGRKTSE